MYNNNENDQIRGGVAAVAEICDKYGFPFNEADLEYNGGMDNPSLPLFKKTSKFISKK